MARKNQCDGESHFKGDYPKRKEGYSRRDDVICFYCNAPGHFKRDCPKLSGRGEAKCFNCNEPGHFKGNCPKLNRRRCFYCNEPGHFRGNCPKLSDTASPGNNVSVATRKYTYRSDTNHESFLPKNASVKTQESQKTSAGKPHTFYNGIYHMIPFLQ